MRILSMQDRSFLGRWWWSVDKGLLAAICALVLFGAGLVFTASPPVAIRNGLDAQHFAMRHLIYLVPAVGMMLVASMLDNKLIWRLATVMGVCAIIGVILTLFYGMETKGATRWVSLFGFSVQPSEFLKPAFVVVAGWLLARQKTMDNFPGFWIATGLFAIVCALLLAQPDVGMTAVVVVTYFAMVFLAGCPLRYVAVMCGLGIVGLIGAYFGMDHFQSRIDRFLTPGSGDTFQVDRSLEAFANGGFFGTGFGSGEIKRQLPDAHADFIFSVAAEEFGAALTLILLGTFMYIFWRAFQRLMGGNSVFAMLAGGGLLIMLSVQTFIHMGSATQILPAKGMTLPLISYGGSSLVAVGITFGILLALTKGAGIKKRDYSWKVTGDGF